MLLHFSTIVKCSLCHYLHYPVCYNVSIVDKYNTSQLETLPKDLSNDKALHQGLKILARIISRRILSDNNNKDHKEIPTSSNNHENIP